MKLHEHEKARMKEATNELTRLVTSLNLGGEEIPIKEYVQLAREEIVDVEYNMVELVELTWGREILWGLKLNGFHWGYGFLQTRGSWRASLNFFL